MNRLVEIFILLVVCYMVFFAGLGRYDYINTESLRAVVVEEMLDREGLSMPTIHQVPYLKKPPLYAWTTMLAARAAGDFNETIARLPSAISGTLLVLLLYMLGERWIGRGGGLPAAVLALMNPTVLDYSVRAELDLPFAFFTAAAIALTLAALRKGGGLSAVCWLAAYTLALVAAMWKGPHSLIFMWLTMLGYGRMARNWSFLRSPFQWIGLVAVLGVLLWWTKTLSAFAGSSTVGRAAVIELFARLVPHTGEHFVSMVVFIPALIVVTVPASVFALLSFRREVRAVCGMAGEGSDAAGGGAELIQARLGAWWQGLKASPLGLMILAWLLPNLVFMLIAPAKSPRYTLPIFPAIFLLGAWMIVLLASADPAGAAGRHYRLAWRGVFVALAIGGAAVLLRAALGLFGVTLGIGDEKQWAPFVIMGIGWIAPLVADLARAGGCALRTRLVMSLVVVLAAQPLLRDVWQPARVAADSQRDVCRRINEIVPAGENVFVLGVHEYPDTQIYSGRKFRFVGSIDEALAAAGGERAYCIVRESEVETLTRGALADYRTVFEFERGDRYHLVIEVAPPAAAH